MLFHIFLARRTSEDDLQVWQPGIVMKSVSVDTERELVKTGPKIAFPWGKLDLWGGPGLGNAIMYGRR